MGRKATSVVMVGLVVASLAAVPTEVAYASTPATVTVNTGNTLGALNNPAWYHNQTGPPLPAGNEQQAQALGSRVTRTWVWPPGYYDVATGTYNFDWASQDGSTGYQYYDQVARYSDRLMMNFLQCPQTLMTLAAPAACRAVLKAGIKHYKQRYPMLAFVEIFNEPDKIWPVNGGEDPALSVADYYQWYKIGYSIVNEVNAELNPAVPIKVGGPVAYTFDTAYIQGFLDLYRDDSTPAKRLDFISYHQYGRRSDPATVANEKSTVQSWLTSRSLPATTPVYVTEYGVFPGSASGTTFQADVLTQAAAIATLGNFYVQGGMDAQLNWVFNHPSNERKSMFVDGVDGVGYPYYNLVKMQTMLKANRVSAQSNALSPAGLGVNALATADDTGIAVLVTNYQWTTGVTDYAVTLNVQNLPAVFSGRDVRVEQYLVDATTSNYANNPNAASLQRVDKYVIGAGAAVHPITLGRNAMSLIVLTPTTYREGEALPATTSPGDQQVDIADNLACGGMLNKFIGNAVGDYVRYTVDVPRTDTYDVWLRMKKTPERGIAQVDIDGVALSAPVDTYSTGYEYVDVRLGTRTMAAGNRPFTFTIVGTSGSSYTLGVDYIELVPATTTRVEVETYVPRIPSGDPYFFLTDGGASGGGLVKFDSDATGDAISSTFFVKAGTYRLSIGVKKFPNRGICQFSVNGVLIGDPQNLYAPAASFASLQIGDVTVMNAGNWTIGCTVTGHDPSSSGYQVALDHVSLAPATS